MSAKAKKKDRPVEADNNMARVVDHVAVDAKQADTVQGAQPLPNFGEMVDGLRDLSGVLQRGFEDIGDNFLNMRRDMSDSFAELKRENRLDVGVPPGQAWKPRQEHEISDISDNEIPCNSWRKDAPSAAGSVLELDTGPKDEFFERFNEACRRPSKYGDSFPEGLAAFINANFEAPIGELKMREYMDEWLRPEAIEWLQAPEVPGSVWRLLSGDVRSVDKTLQNVQSALSTAITGMGRCVQMGREEKFGDALDKMMSVIQIMCHIHRGLVSEERRRRLRKVLPPSYKGLVAAKDDTTPTAILGNISDNAKEISETARLSAQLSASRRGKTQGQFSGNRNSGNRSKPYDRGGSSSFRGPSRSFQARNPSYRRQ